MVRRVLIGGLTVATVAVNVTDWPETEGFCEEINPTVVPACPTVRLTAVDVLPVKVVSPP